MKILLVEDDGSMQKSIAKGLRKFGYSVEAVSDGEAALQAFEINEYDAIILDLNLPKVDGMNVLKEIRKANQEIGVLILTARSELDDIVLGLDNGANDYMDKPFHFKELEARLRALLRRKFIQLDATLIHGAIALDTAHKCVHFNGKKVELTKKEYGILEYLILHKDKAVSAEELVEHVWDSETDLFSNSVKVHINSLNKKLSAELRDDRVIKNTRGVGYSVMEVGE